MSQKQCGVTAVISTWFSVDRLRSPRPNQCSSHVQTAHSVRGRVHLKWIRGSYNKHSHKTIITQPGSTMPSRHSRTTWRCWERNGNVLSLPKSTHKDRPDSPPANTCLFTCNVLLQLVWRRYAVMSQPQDVLCPPLPPPLSHIEISQQKCLSSD